MESPDSNNVIVVIIIDVILPIPEWWISFFRVLSNGDTEPVSMNCPGSCRLSTSFRIASQSIGASCHSSIRRGGSLSSRTDGDVYARAMFWSLVSVSCISMTDFACCLHVVDFPHHFGPSTRTAPLPRNLNFSISSAIRGKYLSIQLFSIFIMKKSTHSVSCRRLTPYFAELDNQLRPEQRCHVQWQENYSVLFFHHTGVKDIWDECLFPVL